MKKIASAMITNPATEPITIPAIGPGPNCPILSEQLIVESPPQHLALADVNASPNSVETDCLHERLRILETVSPHLVEHSSPRQL